MVARICSQGRAVPIGRFGALHGNVRASRNRTGRREELPNIKLCVVLHKEHWLRIAKFSGHQVHRRLGFGPQQDRE